MSIDANPETAVQGIQYTRPGPVNEALPELFETVALTQQLGNDGKALVDATPKARPNVTMGEEYETLRGLYGQESKKPGFDPHVFWDEHLSTPDYTGDSSFPVRTVDAAQVTNNDAMKEYVGGSWHTFKYDDRSSKGSREALPNPHMKPASRFDEGYYWDTEQGLLGYLSGDNEDQAERATFAKGVLGNFAYQIDQRGYIPNGPRTYYDRSQPPVYARLASKVAETLEDTSILERLGPSIEKEYNWWTQGAQDLNDSNQARVSGHSVLMPDGDSVLQRYYSENRTPRPESYREDIETAQSAIARDGRAPEETYQNLRAGAESGRDFTGMHCADPERLETIRTTQMIPPDLNALLGGYERLLAELHDGNDRPDLATQYREKLEARTAAMNKWLYQDEGSSGFYSNYIFEDPHFYEGAAQDTAPITTTYPVTEGIANDIQTLQIARTLQSQFLHPGGLVSSLVQSTGQQWDSPNGWAPDQLQGVHVFERAKAISPEEWSSAPDDLRSKWLRVNRTVHAMTGVLLEKCNVENPSTPMPVDGEYSVQPGFLWTNGTVKLFLDDLA